MGPLTSGQYEGGTQLLRDVRRAALPLGVLVPRRRVASRGARRRAAELGYEALALTDHDGVYGSLEFAHAAKLAGIRPITGAEVTLSGVARRSRSGGEVPALPAPERGEAART